MGIPWISASKSHRTIEKHHSCLRRDPQIGKSEMHPLHKTKRLCVEGGNTEADSRGLHYSCIKSWKCSSVSMQTCNGLKEDIILLMEEEHHLCTLVLKIIHSIPRKN